MNFPSGSQRVVLINLLFLPGSSSMDPSMKEFIVSTQGLSTGLAVHGWYFILESHLCLWHLNLQLILIPNVRERFLSFDLEKKYSHFFLHFWARNDNELVQIKTQQTFLQIFSWSFRFMNLEKHFFATFTSVQFLARLLNLFKDLITFQFPLGSQYGKIIEISYYHLLFDHWIYHNLLPKVFREN